MIVKMDLTHYQLSRLGAFLDSAENLIAPPEGRIFVHANGLQKGLFYPDQDKKNGRRKLVTMRGSAAKEGTNKQTVALEINEYEYITPPEYRLNGDSLECVGSGQPKQPEIYFFPTENITNFFQKIGRFPEKSEAIKQVAGQRIV